MKHQIFDLDAADASGIFHSVGANTGQILGMMTPYLLAKYLEFVPLYTKTASYPSYLLDKKERKYGFVFSASDVFDLANSYELGFGRKKDKNLQTEVDHVLFLNKISSTRFSAITIDAKTVARIAINKKVNLATHRKATG
jgi:hypothetical protein